MRSLGVVLGFLSVAWMAGCSGGKSNNPLPTLGSLNPTSVTAGNAAFTLSVAGTGFVSTSTVQWNGTARVTTFVSSTQLQAAITAADVATAGTVNVTVSSPTPGGGVSSAVRFTIDNPSATLASLNPNTTFAGSPAFTLSVTGTGFVSTSTVQWNGTARVTTFVSSTQLQAAITAADVTIAGTVNVTVSNPTPGGGVSSAVMFTIDNPSPTLVSLNPNSAFAGGAAFTLNLTGTNFVSTSTVLWNGSSRPTTFVSSTQLQAAIPASDIALVGAALVKVSNPAPGGGTSGASNFTIAPPPPTISQLIPSSAIAGSGAFTLNVSGSNFVNSSTVQWSGVPRTTTFVSSTQLQAAINAADVAAIGVSQVTVSNPAASGGNSTSSTFFTGSFGGPSYAVVLLNQDSADLVYDPIHQMIYLSVQNSAATNPNTISVLGLPSASIVSATPAGSQPNVLAISDDSNFLYAGIDGSASVQRFTLPGLAKDISYPLGANPFFGNYFALDIQVAPATPHTTAVTLANVGFSPSAQGGITIFDDAIPRPTTVAGFSGTGNLFDSLQWGSDATVLYAANNEDTAFDFYTLTVNSSGVSKNQDFMNTFSGFGSRIHFDRGTKFVYSDDGHAVDPSNGHPVGNFATSGVMVPDSTLNSAFFAASLTLNNITIQSFDLTHFTTINSITFSIGNGNPVRLIRWGQNGLAFITNGGQVGLIGGNFIH